MADPVCQRDLNELESDADAAFARLRELKRAGRDTSAARAELTAIAAQLAQHAPPRQARVWQVYATHAWRDLAAHQSSDNNDTGHRNWRGPTESKGAA